MYTMALVNIGNTLDPFYRYKRPVCILHQSKGFTHVTNLEQVCKALKCKTTDLEHWLKKDFGTSIQKGKISGSFTVLQIEESVNKFIDKFVLCSVCALPELDEKRVCKACGKYNKVV